MRMKIFLAGGTALGAMTPAERSLGRYMRAPDGHEPAAADTAFADAFNAALKDTPAASEESQQEDPPAGLGEGGSEGSDPPPAGAPSDDGEASGGGGDAAGDGDGSGKEPSSTGADPVEGAPPPAGEQAQQPPAQQQPTPQDIVAQLAEALRNNSAAAQPQTLPAGGAAAPETTEAAPLYTEQELSEIAEYDKNWPDVSRAETLKRRAEYHDLLKFVFTAVRDWAAPQLQQITALNNLAHEQQLKEQVPDYTQDLEKQVAEWIETEPAYLQAGMKQVMQSGTSDEVADLIRRYRAATGAQSGSSQPAPAGQAAPAKPADPAPKTELSSAAKQAAESLAPVSGERSAVPQGEDPQDFVSAFKKYAAAGD